MIESTREVIARLRAEGFDLDDSALRYLLRSYRCAPPDRRAGTLFLWSDADVDRLKSALWRTGRGPQVIHAEGVR